MKSSHKKLSKKRKEKEEEKLTSKQKQGLEMDNI